jgi:hypothetical protein
MSTIKLKRGHSSKLKSLELKAGEPAFALDTKKLYIGTGTEIAIINPDIGENEITDTHIGNRTINQKIADEVSDTGTLTQLFSFIAKIIKGITGQTYWYDIPIKNINQLDTEISAHTGNNSIHVTQSDKTSWADKYTKTEIDNKLSSLETNIDWKEAVDTYENISAAYPTPQDGWTVNVRDTEYTYRYSGKAWVAISANAIPKATASLDGLMSKEDKAKLDISAGLNSPALTGTPTAPTPASDDNSTRLATTAYVKSLVYIPYGGAIDGGSF